MWPGSPRSFFLVKTDQTSYMKRRSLLVAHQVHFVAVVIFDMLLFNIVLSFILDSHEKCESV